MLSVTYLYSVSDQHLSDIKFRPRTGYEGPEWEQMYNSTLPSTSALDEGGWSAPRPGRFSPDKDPIPIV